MEIIKRIVPESKYSIKCPNVMNPEFVVIHNTANDASASNEISYMTTNNNQVSFHFAIDDIQIIQGIETNRNTWHAEDGANGAGNRKGIAIEICYSKSGGSKFDKAEENTVIFVAKMLKERNWGIEQVKSHRDFSGKNCPHRTEFQKFKGRVVKEMEKSTNKNGWLKEEGLWFYYKGGVKQTKWLQIGKNWYWLDEKTGIMSENCWQCIGGKFYFFHAGGSMASNVTISGRKLNDSGAMIEENDCKEIAKEVENLKKIIENVKKAVN